VLQSETHTIEGVTYKVTQLPFKRGQRLLVRLFKTLGPALAAAIAAAPRIKGRKLGEMPVAEVLPGISQALLLLSDKLSEQDMEYVTDTLAELTEFSRDGKTWLPLSQELEFHFAGRYGAFLKWLGFALRVNYLGFSNGLGLLEGLLAKVAAEAPPSPTTSTGTSTESSPAAATA
jgi:hypothetical protein